MNGRALLASFARWLVTPRSDKIHSKSREPDFIKSGESFVLKSAEARGFFTERGSVYETAFERGFGFLCAIKMVACDKQAFDRGQMLKDGSSVGGRSGI